MIECKDKVKNNIVIVTDDKSNFGGTGFFIQQGYCVTCHHNICNMDTIKVGREGKYYFAEWIEEYSDIEKDIAVLKVKDAPFEPLECAHKLLQGLDVVVWGFPKDYHTSLPFGKTEYGSISDDEIVFEWPQETVVGQNKWNKKSKISIPCYQLNQTPGVGFSGAPVCYKKYPCVVGIYEAQDERSGYVIPIETILAKFNQEKVITFSRHSNIVSLLDVGNSYFRKEQYNQAIEYYEKILKDPNFVITLGNKGKSLSNMSKHEKAIECYNKAIDLDPQYAFAWNGKGLSLCSLGKYDESIECYNKAIDLDPQYAFAWNGKGLSLDYLGKYDEAIECYNKAIEINPNYSEAWNGKGFALEKTKKLREAMDCYYKAIEINENDADAWSSRGFTFTHLYNYDEAIECYNKAIEINPNHNRAWNGKGFALYHLKKYDEAIECYNKAIEINPNHNRAWNNKGKSLYCLRKYDEAIECYNKAIEINPKYIYPWVNKCFALNKIKKYNESIDCAEKAIEIDPKSANAWIGKGTALEGMFRYEESIECYDKSISIQPEYGQAWYNRSCCHILNGNIENSLKDLKKAIDSNAEKYSKIAKEAYCFKHLQNDERFLLLVKY